MPFALCGRSASSKNRIRALCERTGLRIEELADRIRTDPNTLQSIADGEDCSSEMKMEIVQGLGLHPSPEHVKMVFPPPRSRP